MSGAMRIDFDHKDLVKMYKTLDRVGASPQKALNKGTSKAATILKRAIKEEAPVSNGPTGGTLKSGIVTKTERSRYQGKKVREITLSKQLNPVFQKPIKHPGVLGGKSKHGYYPASMEYGFLVRVKGQDGKNQLRFFLRTHYRNAGRNKETESWISSLGDSFLLRRAGGNNHMYYIQATMGFQSRKVEGEQYMLKGSEKTSDKVKLVIIETMTKELDKIWQSRNG